MVIIRKEADGEVFEVLLCTERLLPSSISFEVGAIKQIMLGGCLALRRSFCASCKSRSSFVVSSNFCWKCRASVTDRKRDEKHAVSASSGVLQLPRGNPPPVLGCTRWAQYILSFSALMWHTQVSESRGGHEGNYDGLFETSERMHNGMLNG